MQTSWDGCLGHDRRARVYFSLQQGFGLIAEELAAYVDGGPVTVALQWGLGLIAEELPEVTGSIFG